MSDCDSFYDSDLNKSPNQCTHVNEQRKVKLTVEKCKKVKTEFSCSKVLDNSSSSNLIIKGNTSPALDTSKTKKC